MPNVEIWDAYDSNSNKLGYDLYRDEAYLIPNGVYHIVVEIYTVTKDKEILITQRHSKKTHPLKWEITGGSILKGETPEKGALRELKEETGILAQESDLRFVYSCIIEGTPSIYYCYLIVIDKDNTRIELQDEETVDYRYMAYDEFKQFIQTEEYVDTERNRFNIYEEQFDNIIYSI